MGILTGTIFRVWFFTVKPKDRLSVAQRMPNLLPPRAISTPVREIRGKISAPRLSRYPCAVLLLPPAPAPGDWAALPFADHVQGVFAQKKRKAGDFFELRLGKR